MSPVESVTGTVSSHTVPLDFHNLHLTSLLVSPYAVQPTGILSLEVIVKDFVVRKCGDFTAIYRGEVLTPRDTFPVRPSPDGHDDHANPTQKNVAIKRFRDHSIRRGILSTLADTEATWSSLKHPNICPIWLLRSSTELIPAIATPWFANGNVVDFIRQNVAINKFEIVKQLANALAYIHAMGEVHGNIIPSNIMMADDGRPCISDVGLNIRLSKIKYIGTWPVPAGWMFKAPEELSPRLDLSVFSATKEMDVYAFASTVYTIFTAKAPFSVKPYGGVLKRIRGHVPEQPMEISDTLWNLLQNCWSFNPEDRPSMAATEIALAAM